MSHFDKTDSENVSETTVKLYRLLTRIIIAHYFPDMVSKMNTSNALRTDPL